MLPEISAACNRVGVAGKGGRKKEAGPARLPVLTHIFGSPNLGQEEAEAKKAEEKAKATGAPGAASKLEEQARALIETIFSLPVIKDHGDKLVRRLGLCLLQLRSILY